MLYVGKAKSLRKRVSSYTYVSRLPDRTLQLVTTAHSIQTKVLASELEALLVEAELIRTYRPRFNVLLKDDKSPIYVHISTEHFPRVTPVRKNEIISQHLKGTILGPFQSAYKLREVLYIARDIFPWCSERGDRESVTKPCFYYHIGLCSGACIGEITAEEYKEQIKRLTLFLRGKKKEVVTVLESQMITAADKELFEKAARMRDQLLLIKEVTNPKFHMKPDLVLSTPLTSQTNKERIVHLRRVLHTYQAVAANSPLTRIECYDVSNISGQLAAVAMVTFIDGEPAKAEYRLFNIKTLNTPNDYHMMKEALVRRQNHPEWGRPDLIVIDGGKGQLRAALSIWNWHNPVISIAKDPDRIIIPDLASLNSLTQSATMPGLKYHILSLPETHPGLQLIQNMRDEAHRFSKKQFSRRKLKAMLEG